MSEINRSLIVVKPKQPLLDWALSIDDEGDLNVDNIRNDSSTYLIPQIEFSSDEMPILGWCVDFVFEQELYGWHTDETLWPKQRDLATFLEWFNVEFHSLVFDLTPHLPLEHLDYGDIEDDEKGEEDDEPGSNGHPSSNGH